MDTVIPAVLNSLVDQVNRLLDWKTEGECKGGTQLEKEV